MKTTVEIEDHLLREAKKIAVDRGCTLRQLIEEGLRHEVVKGVPRKPRHVRPLPTSSAPWPEGLDISSREKMWEWIDSAPRTEPE